MGAQLGNARLSSSLSIDDVIRLLEQDLADLRLQRDRLHRDDLRLVRRPPPAVERSHGSQAAMHN